MGPRQMRSVPRLAASLVAVLALGYGGALSLAWAQPVLDTDGDGYIDTLEIHLGADRGVAESTPESISIPETCFDGEDNDGDGLVDDRDPGCMPPPVFDKEFPQPGVDVFDSHAVLEQYAVMMPNGERCLIDFEGAGPTVVVRNKGPMENPDDQGMRRIVDVEIVAMQLGGTMTFGQGCPEPPGTEIPATIVEDPSRRSVGEIRSVNPDPGLDFPAESFFEVFFFIETPMGVMPGGPPDGKPGAPVHVSNPIINSIPPYYSPGNPDNNPDCFAVGKLPNRHCPRPPLGHFLCYKGKFTKFNKLVVGVKDQFWNTRMLVQRPELFCNPTIKIRDNSSSPIPDGYAHLKCYKDWVGGFKKRKVRVLNQFGWQTLTVTGPRRICLPTRKNKLPPPRALDHFQCYQVKGKAVKARVWASDQFGRTWAELVRPETLCAPMQKNHNGVITQIGDPASHLVCYQIKAKKIYPRQVVARNQFGTEGLIVEQPVTLCAPSRKYLVAKMPKPRKIEDCGKSAPACNGVCPDAMTCVADDRVKAGCTCRGN